MYLPTKVLPQSPRPTTILMDHDVDDPAANRMAYPMHPSVSTPTTMTTDWVKMTKVELPEIVDVNTQIIRITQER